jgi:hypothetical protein
MLRQKAHNYSMREPEKAEYVQKSESLDTAVLNQNNRLKIANFLAPPLWKLKLVHLPGKKRNAQPVQTSLKKKVPTREHARLAFDTKRFHFLVPRKFDKGRRAVNDCIPSSGVQRGIISQE